ncbi:AraC family transcriptional regulator [Sorangium cellulosum]|uniref:HTH araC/xylS-type domain-containing protein n=1 Tax=Sorangium cellulosum TaxID=56 RepID=A0A150QQ53_SORCE|nr:AraC family transcriptional regulator [Sorangium cellulosum]KYF70099.1 hypothetical protein BE15_00850 [Sorangium cellulosum]
MHDRSSGEAAVRLGYDFEAAFSRAFKRFSGVPPSALRRLGRDEGSRASRVEDPWSPVARSDRRARRRRLTPAS